MVGLVQAAGRYRRLPAPQLLGAASFRHLEHFPQTHLPFRGLAIVWTPRSVQVSRARLAARAPCVRWLSYTATGPQLCGLGSGKPRVGPSTIPIAASRPGALERGCSSGRASMPRNELPKRYDPAEVESDARYNSWKASFGPPRQDTATGPHERFTMMLPPPNVTGTLHLGHALTIAVQDTLARWHRARGTSVLWLPGSDHAGIATQTVVEKELARATGQTRHDLGRKAFVDAVWAWKTDKGSAILRQMERLGASLDWDRNVFTLDPRYSLAVTEAFVRLHDRGLIYRRERIVNWSPALRSALSDIEVDKVVLEGPTAVAVPGYDAPVTFGRIYTIGYPVHGDRSTVVEVATTRPETMLGDVAVAVHPADPRYTHLHGKQVVNPVTLEPIPVVLDPELVDPELGTGVVKITPAHDPNDARAGRRHGCEARRVIDAAGRIVWPEGPGNHLHGLPRFAARDQLLRDLEAKGHLVRVEDHPMVLPVCSRSGDVIEPMLSPQWFVDSEAMAARALEAVSAGELEILPAQYAATWREWLDNIEDWCISRQLWWGHQIPAYRASVPGRDAEPVWAVGRTADEARAKAAALLGVDEEQVALEQDEDVLDTWFASALFPFASLGWPNATPDLARHFPGTLLETGHDILFFWVARMVMVSLELTGELPFRQVYLHAMVRDTQGKKMSKSLGNVIDPEDVIRGVTADDLVARITGSTTLPPAEIKRAAALQRKQFPAGIPPCGADALRFSLLSYTALARDIKFDVERVAGHRAFLNKVWNATRFVLMITENGAAAPATTSDPTALPRPTGLPAAWIASRLAHTVEEADRALTTFNFAQYTSVLREFWVTDFCDNFIELAKAGVRDPTKAAETQAWLLACVQAGTELLAPATPFIADAILGALPQPESGPEGDRAPGFPSPSTWNTLRSVDIEDTMANVLLVAQGIRALPVRQIDPRVKLHAFARGNSADSSRLLTVGEDTIRQLSRASSFTILADGEAPPDGCWVVPTQATCDCAVFARTETPLDPARISAELTRLARSKENLHASREKVKARMAGTGYAKAPQAVKDRDEQTLMQLTRQAEDITEIEAMYTSWLGA